MARRPTLLITRGYPGSGKTTLARQWLDEDTERRVRANRDDLREALYPGVPHPLGHRRETAVSAAQQAAVRALLAAGRDVVVDDTNLRLSAAKAWGALAAEQGARFQWLDVETDADECVRRDAARAARGERAVGEDVVRGFARRYRLPWPDPTPDPPDESGLYVPDPSLPDAWLVDLDGTMCLKRQGPGERSFYDWSRVGEDLPNKWVIDLVHTLGEAGDAIVFMSGRDGSCRPETEAWLAEHYPIPYAALHMRAAGDSRGDDVVKRELFDAHVRGTWNVLGVADDRDKVVDMWRAMGLGVAQVARGAF